MPNNTCLIIADDLTGGADTGAKFAERGLDTLLVSMEEGEGAFDCSAHAARDVLVVNTDTRGASPEEASSMVLKALETCDRARLPLIYKKIDSTLRGNLGSEIDALLGATGKRLAFLAPSFPEQGRVVVGGMLLVDGRPLALADVPQDREGGRDSLVERVLAGQCRTPSAVIDLQRVAAGPEDLCDAIGEARAAGAGILIFDAVRRQDLAHVAEAAFRMVELPLLVGSAGLAEEVARVLAGSRKAGRGGRSARAARAGGSLSRVLMVCGSKSGVTREQIEHVEKACGVRSFELPARWIEAEDPAELEEVRRMGAGIASALVSGHVLLKACSATFDAPGASEKIAAYLGRVVRCALDWWNGDARPIGLILTGGATASSVLGALGAHGVEITGEIIEGIARGGLVGGHWNGVTVVTKAGGFGTRECFERIVRTLCGGI